MLCFVALYIGFNFYFPEISIIFWPYKILAPLMPMPKTPINKYNCFIFWKHNIRCSRQSPVIFTIAKTSGKQVLSHKCLWLGVFATDLRHIIATIFLGFDICHRSTSQANFSCFSEVIFLQLFRSQSSTFFRVSAIRSFCSSHFHTTSTFQPFFFSSLYLAASSSIVLSIRCAQNSLWISGLYRFSQSCPC